jgi:hypothetical protein
MGDRRFSTWEVIMLTDADSDVLRLANMIRHRGKIRWEHGAEAPGVKELNDRIEKRYGKLLEKLYAQALLKHCSGEQVDIQTNLEGVR